MKQLMFGSVCLVLLLIPLPTAFAQAAMTYAPLSPDQTLVAQTLLSLFHDPLVLKELSISKAQFEDIRPALQQIDGPWWRARIRSAPEQRQITAAQEAQLMDLLRDRFGETTANRLRQLELLGQGSRCLIRPEVVQFLRLSAAQVQELEQAFQKTDQLAVKASAASGTEASAAQAELQKAKAQELKLARSTLNADQQRLLSLAIGKPFDTTQVQRIYPLAPELIDSGSWVGSAVTLEQQRGKVVLLHFYAFQCHNCIANYNIYNRWRQELADKGVVVIGIQTPETAAERNFEKVTRAAKNDGFQFPVLVDLKSENWTAWSNTMWPTVYVIDKSGFVRMWWQGELNWQGATGDQKIEDLVAILLKET